MAYVKGQPFLPQFADPATGLLMTNGTVEFYLAGTSTPTPYYTDSSGTSGGTSLTLNSGGKPATDVYFDTSITYKLVVKNAAGTIIETIDPYLPADSSVIAGITAEALTKVKRLQNVAAIQAANLTGVSIIQTEYHTYSGYGGATYIADTTDTTTADDAFLCIVSNDGVRFKLDLSTSLNIAQTGAQRGATDSRAKIQAAIDACDTNKTPLVWFGEYSADCSSTEITMKDIKIIAYGWKNSILNITPPSSGIAINANSRTMLDIQDLKIVSTVAKGGGTTPILFKARNCTGLKIIRNNIQGGYFGLDIDSDDVDLSAWAASTSVTSGEERQHMGYVYSADSTGTTGTTPIRHTSGSVSDGAINWTYQRTIYDSNKNHIIKSNVAENQDSTGFIIDGVFNSEIDGNRATNCGDKGTQTGDGFKVRGLSNKNRITNNTADNNGRDGFDTFDGLIDTIFESNVSESNGLYGYEFKGTYGGASNKIDDYVSLKSNINGNHAKANGYSGFSWHTMRNCIIGVNSAVDNVRYGHEIVDVKECTFLGLLAARNQRDGVKLIGGTSPSTRNTFVSIQCTDNSWSSAGVSANYKGFDGLSIEYACSANTFVSVRSGNGQTSTDYGNQAHGISFSDELTISMTSGAITDFLPGEQLNFGTSGAVARFDGYEGSKIYYTVFSGTPQNAETVTGAASTAAGTTASIATTVTNANHFVSANLVGNDTDDFNNGKQNDSFVDSYINNTGLLQRPKRRYTNATRPSASSYDAGYAIWNTDDNAYNYSDGSVWRDATGATT